MSDTRSRLMRKKIHAVVVAVPPAALLALLLLFPARAGAAETVHQEEGSTCLVCHGEVKGELAESAHGDAGITCTACHGGDPTAVKWESAMSPAKGFKGRFSPKEKLELCNSCHGDYERMRQYDIPIDQLQQYTTSEHGKALFLTGNEKVAVCTSCHGTHDIKKITDTNASVYPTNVPATCGKCHSNKAYMKPFGVSSSVVSDYLNGVHGRRLMGEDIAAPNCATCHGNHGSAPPGVAEVVNVCGKCHQNVKERFKASRHARKGLECVNCHGNHNNIHPTERIFTMKGKGGCKSCHPGEGTKQAAYIARLTKKIAETKTALEEAKLNIEKAEKLGFYVDEERFLLQEGHTAYLQFANEQHALSLRSSEAELTRATSKATHISENLEIKYRTITDRRIMMGCIIGYLLIVLLLIRIKYGRLKAEYLLEQGRAT